MSVGGHVNTNWLDVLVAGTTQSVLQQKREMNCHSGLAIAVGRSAACSCARRGSSLS